MACALVFDLDGVLIDSEQVWASARQQVAESHRGRWSAEAQDAMMGMSSLEWSRYMHDRLGLDIPAEQIVDEVVERVCRLYRQDLPLMPGAQKRLQELAAHWRLALASSANRSVIALVLDLAGIGSLFEAIVSSEEVAMGKPAPDVYLEAAARLALDPSQCIAVEDSSNGLRAAAAAGMKVVAVPNQRFPPSEEAIELADLVIDSLEQLCEAALQSLRP